MAKGQIDARERALYALICANDGIKAKDLARELGVTRKEVNQYLYTFPFVRDLCYHDEDYLWHGYIRQHVPHEGLRDYSGWYGLVNEFLAQEEEEWFDELLAGCARIGRNLNDTRGLFHSFRNARQTMVTLFGDLLDAGVSCENWELVFELRIKRSKWIRIYADVLVIAPDYVFSLEFKMKDAIDQGEVDQAAKYAPYLEVIFGSAYEIIPALVLTRASDLYTHRQISDSTAEVSVASGDMLFNVFDEYLRFLAQ
ncbi:MAG: hypothetical protein J6D34_07985 [Atopobiaceae bacterium]|nr:hypothetical protein [Atopobiaceae bacterium]